MAKYTENTGGYTLPFEQPVIEIEKQIAVLEERPNADAQIRHEAIHLSRPFEETHDDRNRPDDQGKQEHRWIGDGF